MTFPVIAHHQLLFGDRPVTEESLRDLDQRLCSLSWRIDEDGKRRYGGARDLSEYGLMGLIREIRFLTGDSREVELTGSESDLQQMWTHVFGTPEPTVPDGEIDLDLLVAVLEDSPWRMTDHGPEHLIRTRWLPRQLLRVVILEAAALQGWTAHDPEWKGEKGADLVRRKNFL
ncbi:hypothetical protein [Corynebacterium terpenotabidum]|uniref:Uncharacterized protein n=1 Tax=Corynebacterium terpenotabidum Y-11 TaxID=1200352 RepID=S4XC89_9CORY|nr:hypothetical protein [Corynebacterium terpenotabidum]AGP30099.1 hypothetical protein A606_02230 [Corynebacterium terpenotabidum Y-11]